MALRLEEFYDYKNQFMNDILTDEQILQLLSEDGAFGHTGSEFAYQCVFPYEYVPTTTERATTFICCEVDITKVYDKTFYQPTMYVWLFTHKSRVRLPQGGIRVDKLASRIDEILNGSWNYSLGQFSLESCKRFSPIEEYQGRSMVYRGTDFNMDSSTRRAIPSNRKTG